MAEYERHLLKNDTLASIMNRRSVRMFIDKPVSDDDLRTILYAANQAPSAHNQQSWRFIVLKGEKKNELSNLINTRAADFPPAFFRAAAFGKPQHCQRAGRGCYCQHRRTDVTRYRIVQGSQEHRP